VRPPPHMHAACQMLHPLPARCSQGARGAACHSAWTCNLRGNTQRTLQTSTPALGLCMAAGMCTA
jgi:hypothetical protein